MAAVAVAAAPAQPRLSNHYIRRLTSSPKACFVCSRPSPVVLVSNTAGAHDFFYVCATHLGDRNFATKIAQQQQQQQQLQSTTDAARLPEKVSKEEIEKVKREWEQRQQQQQVKSESKKTTGKEEPEQQGWLAYFASSIGGTGDKTAAADANKSVASADASSPTPTPTPAPAPATPQHEHYSLHRTFYNMRIDSYNKALAVKRAKELNFPSVPRG